MQLRKPCSLGAPQQLVWTAPPEAHIDDQHYLKLQHLVLTVHRHNPAVEGTDNAAQYGIRLLQAIDNPELPPLAKFAPQGRGDLAINAYIFTPIDKGFDKNGPNVFGKSLSFSRKLIAAANPPQKKNRDRPIFAI